MKLRHWVHFQVQLQWSAWVVSCLRQEDTWLQKLFRGSQVARKTFRVHRITRHRCRVCWSPTGADINLVWQVMTSSVPGWFWKKTPSLAAFGTSLCPGWTKWFWIDELIYQLPSDASSGQLRVHEGYPCFFRIINVELCTKSGGTWGEGLQAQETASIHPFGSTWKVKG